LKIENGYLPPWTAMGIFYPYPGIGFKRTIIRFGSTEIHEEKPEGHEEVIKKIS
jgi:hypothetical protein